MERVGGGLERGRDPTNERWPGGAGGHKVGSWSYSLGSSPLAAGQSRGQGAGGKADPIAQGRRTGLGWGVRLVGRTQRNSACEQETEIT